LNFIVTIIVIFYLVHS